MKFRILSVLLLLSLVSCNGTNEKNAVTADILIEDESVSKERKLAKFIEGAEKINEKLPIEIEEGMIYNKAHYSNGYLTMEYVCDEELYDMDELRSNVEEMREEGLSGLKENLTEDQIKLMHYFEIGYELKYTGNTSGKSFSIKYDHTEF